MTKLIKFTIASFVGLALLAGGCTKSKVVDLRPEYQLDAISNPSTLEQVEGLLLGAYAGFRSNSYYQTVNQSGPWSVLPDMMSDNVLETRENLPQDRALTDWFYTPDVAQIENLSRAAYIIVSRVNLILRDIDKFTTPATQARVNRIRGQAFAIRAHVHFDLMRYFSTAFDRNSTSILAMPYVKEFRIASDLAPRRLNNKEYYDNIFADLAQAATLLGGTIDRPVNPTTGNTRPFIDLNGVRAIQARVNLYAEQWNDAITAATAVINARPLVLLADSARFRGMYNETSVGEIIWNVQFDAGQGGPGGSLFFPAGNRNSFKPADEIATIAGTTGVIRRNDIRYNTNFSVVTSSAFGSRLVVRKYNGKGNLNDVNTNFIVFHTGEMYLIRAEAYARSNQATLALNDLNTLKANRIPGYTNLTGLSNAQILEEIANERRAELFAEGHRFFDLKRTTRAIQRTSGCGNLTISPATKCSLIPTAREWALPIPFTEIQVNPNIVQNPGY
jgi:starch-binding outer membrane protein, SusD/RagB family